MDDILKLTADLRTKAGAYGNEIAALTSSTPPSLRTEVFQMTFNNLTLCLELISYYESIWKVATATNATSAKEARKQNGERVILIQKMTFIGILSSVEFCFKNYIRAFPAKIGECKNSRNQVYLSTIVNTSHTTGLISPSDFELWNGLIHLRNYLVHNNGEAQETKTYVYPSSELVLVDGQMAQGNLELFPHLIDWLLMSSKSWLEGMHKK